ncbi:MAG: hypothetical protein GX757_07400 [Clostridiales bacterium]|nr:hypothetical protein [Clostridiales bacterium]
MAAGGRFASQKALHDKACPLGFWLDRPGCMPYYSLRYQAIHSKGYRPAGPSDNEYLTGKEI